MQVEGQSNPIQTSKRMNGLLHESVRNNVRKWIGCPELDGAKFLLFL